MHVNCHLNRAANNAGGAMAAWLRFLLQGARLSPRMSVFRADEGAGAKLRSLLVATVLAWLLPRWSGLMTLHGDRIAREKIWRNVTVSVH